MIVFPCSPALPRRRRWHAPNLPAKLVANVAQCGFGERKFHGKG
jgi:hypothetical protein